MFERVLRTMTGLYPFQTPRASLLSLLPDVPANFGSFRARDGTTYAGYPPGPDHVIKSLFWFGDFDRWVVDTIAKHVQAGDVYCDIGANIGDTALPIARLVGSRGRVFAFEPMPAIRAQLLVNVAANHLENVEVLGVALSDSRGELSISAPVGQPGMASVSVGAAPGSISVPTMTFDEWLGEAGIESIAVCKIDVEGHEDAVFRGMTKTLRERRIRVFVFERHGTAGPADALIGLLRSHGYRTLQIRKTMIRATYVDLGKSGPGAATTDFVAMLDPV